MTDLTARLAEIVAKEDILDVLKRIAKGTDRQDAELIASGYHPDGIDDHGMFYGTGSEFAQWASSRMGARNAKSHHFIGQTIITIEGDVAFSEMYADCHLLSPATETDPARDLFHGVRYVDRFERRDGGPWLIAYRLVVWDWAFFIPTSDEMQLPPETTWGREDRTDPSYHLRERLTTAWRASEHS